jgi:pyruvate dehydrogenase E1 component beta subunit
MRGDRAVPRNLTRPRNPAIRRNRAIRRKRSPPSQATFELAKITMVEAIANAHGWEMQHDDSVVVIGQDVGANGGVFRATAGLQSRFGADRVQDTPLAEATIAGMAVGMATHGLKPVAEIQFMGFMYPALDQIVNHLTRMRYRTRGRLSCPVVIRMPHGGGIHAPEHHSESTETLLCHIPGIRVVCPSSPARAYGLLLAAIRDPDPVMFLEPARLYRAMRQEVADDGRALPLDRCFILRAGSDVSIVTWGAMTLETLRAAAELDAQGVSAEVIDLATLSPIDGDTILDSVAKTGRLVIVHEAARNLGVGAEIAAIVAEHGLYDLQAPIQRVTGFDTIMPLFRLEQDYIPGVQRIVDAVQFTLAD